MDHFDINLYRVDAMDACIGRSYHYEVWAIDRFDAMIAVQNKYPNLEIESAEVISS